MTGFGKSVRALSSKKITVEIKSLNSKNLDLKTRIPYQYREKELMLRNQVSRELSRGKVDFSIYVELVGEETSSVVNTEVVKSYMAQLKKIVDGDEIEILKMAVRMPDAMRSGKEEIDQEEFREVERAVEEALQEIHDFRTAEGKALEDDLYERTNTIRTLLNNVMTMDPERIQGVRERLHKAVRDLKEAVDENRFEQELLYYIEKFDITEEKVRLENHLDYFLETLHSAESNGKKLAFISQEMGREINTIGSKSNYAPMQQLVVQMKDELEKIKEQLLNIL